MLNKNSIYITSAAVTGGLIFGNFLYQLFTKRDWKKAADRSYFQVVSMAAFCTAVYFK